MDKKWIIKNPQKTHTTCYCDYCYHSTSSVTNEDKQPSNDKYIWINMDNKKSPYDDITNNVLCMLHYAARFPGFSLQKPSLSG